MNLEAINRTIRELCAEVMETETPPTHWRTLTGEDILHEAVTCIFGSQMVFEVALAAANRIREDGFLGNPNSVSRKSDRGKAITKSLSVPLWVEVNGRPRKVLPRFKNRLSTLLTKTLSTLQDRRTSLQKILHSARSAGHARVMLIQTVSGFGPKQASLFLRRVGYSNEFAVLDTHILDYLKLARGIELKQGQLSRLSAYERVEDEFRQMAGEFGYPVGCLDLAMWVTMRVAKRENLL